MSMKLEAILKNGDVKNILIFFFKFKNKEAPPFKVICVSFSFYLPIGDTLLYNA